SRICRNSMGLRPDSRKVRTRTRGRDERARRPRRPYPAAPCARGILQGPGTYVKPQTRSATMDRPGHTCPPNRANRNRFRAAVLSPVLMAAGLGPAALAAQVATFSVVGYDSITGQVGVAVQ